MTNKPARYILVGIVCAFVVTGCHHAITTAKAPPAPATTATATAPAPNPVANPDVAPRSTVPSKAPELTEEQLFTQNVRDIFFNYDNAELRSGDQPILSSDTTFLATHPAIQIVIEGHCDERGSDEYNLSLGESRADRVKNALIRGGISAERIKVISYGKERPFCSSADNDACWQQNRRAHFVFQNAQATRAN